jgi:hypothetical protein
MDIKKFVKDNCFVLVAFVLGLVAIFMPLAAGIGRQLHESWHNMGSAYTWIFGGTFLNELNLGEDAKAIGVLTVAWVLLLIALLAVIAAVVLLILKKDIKIGNKLGLISLISCVAAALFIVSGILFFFGKVGYLQVEEISSDYASSYRLGAGCILAGIFAIVAGVTALVPLVMPLISKK